MATVELTAEQRIQRANDLRSRVLLNVPNDFLRLPSTSGQIPLAVLDPAAAQFYSFVPPNTRGRLVIKVVQAQLSKNYGILRMDPYLRLRIGNAVFETHTCVNGGKTPTWNRLINAYLPNGVESSYVQIFDEV
jgi:toll-interacting protein